MKENVLFEEEQSFVGTRTWYLVLSIAVLSIVPGIILLATQEEVLNGLVSGGIAVVIMSGVILLHVRMRLHVTIDNSAIYYRYAPFVQSERTLGKEDIQAMNIRIYRPLWEYGGYGYRFRIGSGRALNVAGRHGLQLILANNKRLLIGTQKPDELERAISQLKENWVTVENHG
ncbi:MAG: hypothetical protein GY816_03345 [Cytophagales bacterium]|nr:hypothetical protein [Cytophagales bacterium]